MTLREATLRSWLEMSPDTPFSLANIPFGIFSTTANPRPRVGTAVGNFVFDIASFMSSGNLFEQNASRSNKSKDAAFLNQDLRTILESSQTLNLLALEGRPVIRLLRKYIQMLFEKDSNSTVLRDAPLEVRNELLIPLDQVTMHLPFDIGDYTDFYAGLHHAGNI